MVEFQSTEWQGGKQGHIHSGILEGFSNELPNSHFRNGEISRNWSKLFMNFLAKCTTH